MDEPQEAQEDGEADSRIEPPKSGATLRSVSNDEDGGLDREESEHRRPRRGVQGKIAESKPPAKSWIFHPFLLSGRSNVRYWSHEYRRRVSLLDTYADPHPFFNKQSPRSIDEPRLLFQNGEITGGAVMITFLLALATLDDTSKAYRPVNFTVETQQSREVITSCAAAKLKSQPNFDGNRVVIPVYLGANMFTHGQNSFSMVIEETGRFRSITALYRHPLSEKSAIATIRDVAKTCFKGEFNAALGRNPTAQAKPL